VHKEDSQQLLSCCIYVSHVSWARLVLSYHQYGSNILPRLGLPRRLAYIVWAPGDVPWDSHAAFAVHEKPESVGSFKGYANLQYRADYTLRLHGARSVSIPKRVRDQHRT